MLRAGACQAPNRARNLRTIFTRGGIHVIPHVFEAQTPPWEWGLTLTGYGYASTAFRTDDASVAPVGEGALETK